MPSGDRHGLGHDPVGPGQLDGLDRKRVAPDPAPTRDRGHERRRRPDRAPDDRRPHQPVAEHRLDPARSPGAPASAEDPARPDQVAAGRLDPGVDRRRAEMEAGHPEPRPGDHRRDVAKVVEDRFRRLVRPAGGTDDRRMDRRRRIRELPRLDRREFDCEVMESRGDRGRQPDDARDDVARRRGVGMIGIDAARSGGRGRSGGAAATRPRAGPTSASRDGVVQVATAAG